MEVPADVASQLLRREVDDSAPPELLADDRSRLQHRPLVWIEQVEPCREKCADRRRHRDLRGRVGEPPARVAADKRAFVEATRVIHINTNPHNAKTLVQFHDRQAVVVNPPSLPLSDAEMDRVAELFRVYGQPPERGS